MPRSRRSSHMMMMSREAVVNYMTPLGLAHIMATGSSLRSGTVGEATLRADWTPVYYHRADTHRHRLRSHGDGQQRGRAVLRRRSRERFANRDSVPDRCLLFFHHARWNDTDARPATRCGTSSFATTTPASTRCARCIARGTACSRRSIAQRFKEVDDFLSIQEARSQMVARRGPALFPARSRVMPIPTGYEQPRTTARRST